MQNLNTKGKDVLAATLHTTLKVIFIAVYICKYQKKWLCIFEFSKLSEALYHSYSKESLVVLGFFLWCHSVCWCPLTLWQVLYNFFFRLCPADSVKNKKKKAEGDVCPLVWWSFESCSSQPSISLFSCVTAITVPLVQGKRCSAVGSPFEKIPFNNMFLAFGINFISKSRPDIFTLLQIVLPIHLNSFVSSCSIWNCFQKQDGTKHLSKDKRGGALRNVQTNSSPSSAESLFFANSV